MCCNPHFAAALLEEQDFTAAYDKAPPVHLALPKDHTMLLVPDDEGTLVPDVPSKIALQVVREAAWDYLGTRTRAHTPLRKSKWGRPP